MRFITSKLKAEFDEQRCAFVSIKGASDTANAEFILNPSEFPKYDCEDARWLGNLFITVPDGDDEKTMCTGCSSDIRKVLTEQNSIKIQYSGDSENSLGLKGLSLKEEFIKDKDGIRWNIEIMNVDGTELIINKLRIPLLMNQYFRNDNEFKYRQCVLRHSLITHHHSLFYWSKSSGEGPILYLTTLDQTPVDSFSVEEEGTFAATLESGYFEGAYSIYTVDKNANQLTNAIPLCLKKGEKALFCFRIGVAESIEEMEQEIVEYGGVVAQMIPGMCVPVEKQCALLIKSKRNINVTLPDGDLLERREVKEDTAIYYIRLKGFGRRKIIISDSETSMYLQAFGIEAPAQIIRRQAAFIADKQFETDPADPCFHALLMWDLNAKRRINTSYNPYDNWFAGGSDEIGLVSGLFLSEKNVWIPNEKEIHTLELYVKDFIEERLTEQPGYKVHRMVPWFEMFEPWSGNGADDVWRAYNYVHVINTYYNMYCIAKKYKYSFLREPVLYLKQAYQYTIAMFSYWMFPEGVGATEYGNMGEGILAIRLPKALRENGLNNEAAVLTGIISKKAVFFKGSKYPFGSEMSYDSTAFEAVYGYGKFVGDSRLMNIACDATLANRGRQPLWYLYETDLRERGDSEWNVSYMTQLGIWPVIDRMINTGEFLPKLVEQWYGAYLAGFSIYNSGGYWSKEAENEGASGWIVEGRKEKMTGVAKTGFPYIKGLVSLSGESALGYFGALVSSKSVIIDHPLLGRYGFGCDDRIEDEREILTPEDALGVAVYHVPGRWSIEIDRDRIKKIVWDKSKHELMLEIENLFLCEHCISITVIYNGKRYAVEREMEKNDKTITILLEK